MSLSGNPEFNTTTVRFNYQSMVTPNSIYDFDLNTRNERCLKQQEVLGGYDPASYEAKRIWGVASDGVKVPISLVHRKGVEFDGKAPLLLYRLWFLRRFECAYLLVGSRGLLDRGVIWAMAYIRGGGELGEEWREQGRMMQKMNTFYDFIDCADFLVKNRYTSTDRLVILGGSAGGLLVGAAMNMRPDLFKAVVAQVPFVDVINTMMDASLPLTTSECPEWGNPNEKPAFDYIMKYLAVRQRESRELSGDARADLLNDSQVPYWEGAKLTAKLRATKTDNNPLLLKANMGAGHGGSSGRYDALRETAFTYRSCCGRWGSQSPVPRRRHRAGSLVTDDGHA